MSLDQYDHYENTEQQNKKEQWEVGEQIATPKEIDHAGPWFKEYICGEITHDLMLPEFEDHQQLVINSFPADKEELVTAAFNNPFVYAQQQIADKYNREHWVA